MNDQEQFKQDMEDAGLEVTTYRGRNYYQGWAVRVDKDQDPHDVIRATKVKLQQDDMGLGAILYPYKRMTDEEFKEAHKN